MTDTVEVLRQEHRNIESLLRVLARLGPFLAHLLGERDVRAHGETAERAVEHAVSMKIHLMTIGGFQESELAGRVDARDGRDRLIFVLFHLPLQAADVILQPSSCMLEGIVDGKPKIGVALGHHHD